jgi:hypothetical protein
MLRRSFRPKKEEEETAWRGEPYKKDFHKLYWSTNVSIRIITKLNLPGHVLRMWHIKLQEL